MYCLKETEQGKLEGVRVQKDGRRHRRQRSYPIFKMVSSSLPKTPVIDFCVFPKSGFKNHIFSPIRILRGLV